MKVVRAGLFMLFALCVLAFGAVEDVSLLGNAENRSIALPAPIHTIRPSAARATIPTEAILGPSRDLRLPQA